MKKKGLILVFVALVFCSFFISAMNISGEIYNTLEGNETINVFVSLNSNLSAITINSVKENLDENLTIGYNSGNLISVEINETQLSFLENNSFISRITPVQERHIFLSSSVPLVNATSAWARQIEGINLTGKGETVCVIDTGVNFSHSDLLNKNLTCLDCTSGVCVVDCATGDVHGHGTHVAGIIAANGTVQGVSPGANLISLRSFNAAGQGSDATILPAIDWCVNNRVAYNISVISLSAGGETLYSSYCDNASSELDLRDEINKAVLNNISVVVATGNAYSTTGIASPACIENSTRVGSIADNSLISSFSNRASFFLDLIFAPGETIVSTSKSGGYISDSGTSMSTPHVSGAIAIINQYKKLESANKLTPNSINWGLNNSGKRIFDSSSGVYFSILDVYSALLYFDNSKPIVNFISPLNHSTINSGNISFSFNISDMQLRNFSIYLWNSSSLINKTDFVVSSNQMSIQTTLSLSTGDYSWNVYSEDMKNNSGFKNYNFTFSVGKVSTRLISPINQRYTNVNSSNFTCESSTVETGRLSNVSFYLWNSSGFLVSSDFKNISGIENSSSFNVSNLIEGNYSWGCVSYDNYSNFSYGNSNYSFVLDMTNSSISLVSPSDSSSYSGAQTINFQYNVNESNLANCSLILGGSNVLTNSSVDVLNVNTFSYTVGVGSYTWKIICYDLASNFAESTTRSLTVSAVSSGSSGGSGGGGSSSVVKITNYSASEFELTSGITKQFLSGQAIKFFIKEDEHNLVVKDIYNDRIQVNIFSDPIQSILYVNKSQKFDLNKDGNYDLQLTYLGRVSTKANLSLKALDEKIPVRYIFNESTPKNNSINDSKVADTKFKKVDNSQENYKYYLFLGLWIVWIGFLFFILIKVIKMGVDLYLEKKKANSVDNISSHFRNQLIPHNLNKGVPPNFKRYYPNDYGKNKGL